MDKPVEADALDAVSEQENAGLPPSAKSVSVTPLRSPKTVRAGPPRSAKKKKKKKKKCDLLPLGERPSAKRELSPREARDVALLVARTDLEGCLAGARGWARMAFTVAADGSIEKVSLDAPNGAI